MYSNLSKWFATTSQVWGNGARVCRAIGRRHTDWSKNKERLIKNIAEIETIASKFGLEVLVIEKGVEQKSLELLRDLADLQNGPPLERYKNEYANVMSEVYLFLEENEKAHQAH